MWYLTVLINDEVAVVTDACGQPREFPKLSKATHFVEGRPWLQKSRPQVVEDISHLTGRFQVYP